MIQLAPSESLGYGLENRTAAKSRIRTKVAVHYTPLRLLEVRKRKFVVLRSCFCEDEAFVAFSLSFPSPTTNVTALVDNHHPH
ncbi:hypothetical protein HZ326_22022 [Fusarium oxysporum f. sp. albedinis]|nr:hypothetical protein HZ326_22022 [Fusarium oxysporum f. sp. albedinis]